MAIPWIEDVKSYVVTLTTIIGLIATVSTTVIWWGDSRWVTHDMLDTAIRQVTNHLAQAMINQRIMTISDNIDDRIIQIRMGVADKSDHAQLQLYREKRDRLYRELRQYE